MAAACCLRVLRQEMILTRKILRCKATTRLFGQTRVSNYADTNIQMTETKKMKQRRLVMLRNLIETDQNIRSTLAPLQHAVSEQASVVKTLKDSGVGGEELMNAVTVLKSRKRELEAKEWELAPSDASLHRIRLEDLLKTRFFYSPSCEIYGGASGFFDLGPLGCGLKTNILEVWRKHFIVEEQMLEVDSSIFTPEPVLRSSGHIDRFSDYMVQDTKTGESYRLNHLIKSHFENLLSENLDTTTRLAYNDIISKLDRLTAEDMIKLIHKFEIKSPSGNQLSEVTDFNLMVKVSVGPAGLTKGFLRPETAQGIFVNFKKLLDFNQGQLPLAAAQIGSAFRNEISPRSGLIRAREFTLAEIEHFVDPNCKDHPKIHTVESLQILLYTRHSQIDGKPAEVKTIKEALQQRILANESLAYYIARTQTFLVKVGVDPKRIRFRQHLSDELSHYATDCWDAECHTSYGWVECVGCSDRSCYDLNQHWKATGINLTAERKLEEPTTVQVLEVNLNKNLIAKTFGQDAKEIIGAIKSLNMESIFDLQRQLDDIGNYVLIIGQKTWELPASMVSVKQFEKQQHVEEFVPHVIEPSFGIGRIIYTVLEHTFTTRAEDQQKAFLALPSLVAPVKCAVLPLGSNREFEPIIQQLCGTITKSGLAFKIDRTNRSIGRRYTHMDQIGVPFAITVDYDSLLEPHTVTLRERDTTAQIRVPLIELPNLLKRLASEELSWNEAIAIFPLFEQQQKATEKTTS